MVNYRILIQSDRDDRVDELIKEAQSLFNLRVLSITHSFEDTGQGYHLIVNFVDEGKESFVARGDGSYILKIRKDTNRFVKCILLSLFLEIDREDLFDWDNEERELLERFDSVYHKQNKEICMFNFVRILKWRIPKGRYKEVAL